MLSIRYYGLASHPVSETKVHRCAAPVGLSHKNSKAATVPNAPVRAVASPMIKRIVSCVARKQDKQKIL